MTEAKEKPLRVLTQSEIFERIADISAAVNVVKNSSELLERSLRMTMDLFAAQRGSIFMVNEESERLVLRAAFGMDVSDEENIEKRLGEGVVGHVAEQKTPIFVSDITQDDRFQNYKARKSYRTPSFICAPLLIKDKLIGVINIADKQSGNRFKSHELQLLDFLATQIALNYHRIKLYEKFKDIIKESRSLKSELGKSSQEAKHLRRQVFVHEKLATIGKLAGGIAHEFNNPLDGIMRYTNLCLEQAHSDDVIHGYLLEIKQGLNRMANIVRSLLACSRNTATTMEKIDPHQLLEQSLQTLQGQAVTKNIRFIKDFKAKDVRIIDLGLERVFTNLLRNAIDAVGANGEIRVQTVCPDHSLEIAITDNGMGIPEEDLEHIFEPFYTTKDIEKGCGLGLTIVAEIVKSYDGTIDIESSKAKGTTFFITLPLRSKYEKQ